MAYYFAPGNVGVVGVNGALRLNMLRPTSQPGATGLGQNHIYVGYAIEKIGSAYFLTGINTDASAQAFYQRGFSAGDSSASNGTITVTSRVNEYPGWSLSAKQLYQLTIVKEQGA